MAVTQTLRALGHWELSLKDNMPSSVWDRLDYFGHIVVHLGRIDSRVAGDSLLASSRYTGVLRGRSESGAPKQISGLDVAMWLGDPDNKSDIVETVLAVDGDFETVIEAVMDGFAAVEVGTIFNDTGPFEFTFQYQSRRQIIDYICQTWGGMAWRVNGDATLDAGPEEDLFVFNPEVAVIRKPKFSPNFGGSELGMSLRALLGSLDTQQDVEDLTTRVLLMAQGINGEFASAAVDAAPGYHPYLDMHGNPIKMTRIAQESDTDAGNADARAQLILNRFLNTRDALNLSTEFYDISGVARVGDYLWVHDPEIGIVDVNNEVIAPNGQRINPLKLQMTETSWPIVQGMSVAYRHWDGTWSDLTDYVEFETGEATIVVGGYNRSLSDGGSGAFPITGPDVNTTIPDAPDWDLPWAQSQYQSPITGETKAEVELKWIKPTNTDLSIITDGDYYEIRYRRSGTPLTDFTLQELDDLTSDISDINTLQYPIITGIDQEWQYVSAPFEVLKFRLQELTPGITYQAQIRAVDTGRPPNIGDWSVIESWQASRDVFPPATPAPPEVAANPMAILITHKLGRSDGGEFNLDRDLAYLEVHAEYEPLFTPTDDTIIGKVAADWGNLTGNIPAVANFQIRQVGPMYFKVIAVDQSGNKSLPSQGVVATAELISDQYIGNLTVGKLTSGTMTASIVNAGLISTGGNGARVDITNEGIKGLNTLNQVLWQASNLTGKISVLNRGGIEIRDGALTILNAAGQVIVEVGECLDGRHGIQVYKDDGTRVARMGELASGDEGIEVVGDLGELVRVSTLAFGTQAASVATNQDRIGTAFGDMITVGPSVNVVVGNTRRMLVGVSAWCNTGSSAGPSIGIAAACGFDVAGPSAYFRAASFFESVRVNTNPQSGADFTAIGATKFVLVSGLPVAGTYTVTAKYSSQSATLGAQFSDRHLIVIPY